MDANAAWETFNASLVSLSRAINILYCSEWKELGILLVYKTSRINAKIEYAKIGYKAESVLSIKLTLAEEYEIATTWPRIAGSAKFWQ